MYPDHSSVVQLKKLQDELRYVDPGNAYFRKSKGTPVDVRTEPKIQRNEPCPCESGKKYKKCCLNK